MSQISLKTLRKRLHALHFKTTWSGRNGNRQEVFVDYRRNGVEIRGFVGLPNDYPCSNAGRYYLVLCHDWDRRANASARRFFTPETMEDVFQDTITKLAHKYDGNFPDMQDF